MKTKLLRTSFARVAPALFLALASSILPPSAHAQVTSWNAFDDFYVNVPATGGGNSFPQVAWTNNIGVYYGVTGLTSPNVWGYAGGNFNGYGSPETVGTYVGAVDVNFYPLTFGGTYAGPGASYFGATSGNYWIGYNSTYGGGGAQIGKYTEEWFPGTPGYGTNPNGINTNKFLWIQGIGMGAGYEGLGSMLTWTAPSSGRFEISGSYVNGNYSGLSSTFAIVDSSNTTLLPRKVLAPASTNVSKYSFIKTLAAGDVIQFQVGTPGAGQGSPLGLSVNIVQITTTNWNAARDFYLSPTATGWTGATNGSKSAWGYYYANVNANGYPSQIGEYFTTATQAAVGRPFLYKFSDISPLGGALAKEGASGFYGGGQANFGFYQDTYGVGTSLGRFDTPWDPVIPGYFSDPRGGIWMQGGWLQSLTGAEGIAPVLTWTAPYSGIYDFKGSFQVAINGTADAGASLAIVDSKGGAPLPRISAPEGMEYPFSFRKVLAQGDVIQFQVGTDSKVGAAVGLNADVTRVGDVGQKVPSSVNLVGSSTLAYTGSGVTPSLTILGSTTPPTYSYQGVDGTSYVPSSNAPTARGRYEVTVTTVDDATWSSATNKFYYSVGTFNAFKDFWWNRTNGRSAWMDPANALAQGRSQGTPTTQNAWGYGMIDCAVDTNTITGANVNLRFRALGANSYNSNNSSYNYLHTGDSSNQISWIAANSNNTTLALSPSTGPGDGLASALRWTAPADGTYRFQGRFVSQSSNPMPVAIQAIDGGGDFVEGTVLLARTVVSAGATNSFDIVTNVVANQKVTWVVGSSGSGGDLMHLSANVSQMVAPTVVTNPTASAISVGQALSNSVISGGAVIPAGGSWAWVAPDTVYSVAGNYPAVTAVYTPADSENYSSITTNISLVVNAAAPARSSFSSWRGSSPATPELLTQYAFGAVSPGSAVSPSSLPAGSVSSDNLVLTYYVRKDAANSSLVIPQTHTNLADTNGWNTNGITVSPPLDTNNFGGVDVVKRTASVPIDTTSRKFLRLKIQE